jgi:hypothetical protein
MGLPMFLDGNGTGGILAAFAFAAQGIQTALTGFGTAFDFRILAAIAIHFLR